MRMLRWMIGINRIEKIRNEEIRARAGVANISENIRIADRRWLGCVERNIKDSEEDVVMRTWKWVSGHRKIGRPKLRWRNVIRTDMLKRERSKDRRSLRL